MNKFVTAMVFLVATQAAHAQQAGSHPLTPEEQCAIGADIAGKARSAQDQGVSEDDFLSDMSNGQDAKNIANLKKIADYTYASASGGDPALYRDWYKERCMSVLPGGKSSHP
ncbi:hypothetical protein L2Y96_08350 [Luteibacter aegosomaticola]|uniref:hypothetical protein n=1 Tax=Luteibacter aegosomaticola TaxID=2911538 RepID=UPI001FFA32B8|nr:hypothetical protein [Luteibacter aegosomaticola]UPG91763.1 hypothetical protein L2Y96_08350 [Luteibacter aegosomaticola]